MADREQRVRQQAAEIEALRDQGMSDEDVAEKLGIHVATLYRRLQYKREMTDTSAAKVKSDSLPNFHRWDVPENEHVDFSDLDFDDNYDEFDMPIEELIEARRERFKRYDGKRKKKHIRDIGVNIKGPIAITHFGDPHVDDDGCNWPKLLRCVEVVSQTPGMFAGNIGDTTNNWVGRLQRLWAHQSTTLDEAVRLGHWLFHSVPWLYCVLGNHDKWNNGAQLLHYLTKGARIAAFCHNTARINLTFPKGNPIRIVARHDFKGSSIWNRAHGPMRESKLNPWGDIYISGHRHIWVSHHEEGTDGKPRWSLIVRGFKYHDEYAEDCGFYEHEHGEACTTIIDPTNPSPMERIKVVWDVDEAADMLNWKRAKAGLSRQDYSNPLG